MRTNGIEVADIFREYGTDFRKNYSLPEKQTSIMNLIVNCRTSALGSHIDRCNKCGYETAAYNSCRNRHCPKCQHSAREKWIAARQSELLPVSYYHIVFTIPNELNPIVLVNKRTLYGILFKAASQTLLTLSKDPKHLGADIGFIAILHTWGQTLTDHPHLHCIVPGGGLSPDGKKWKRSKKFKYNKFFIHVNIISDLFKKKFLYYFKKTYKNKELQFVGKVKSYGQTNEFYKLLNLLYEKKWITYIKRPFGGPKQVLEYLGRYTHRVAISNSRIKRIENGKVVFQYRDYRDNTKKEMALSPVEFIRRFMLHILPEGFFKIRYYGILSSRRKKALLEKCRKILSKKKSRKSKDKEAIKSFTWQCPKCKTGRMHFYKAHINYAPG
jgi:predicted Zn-ribbon and HTH transcriptional regulator